MKIRAALGRIPQAYAVAGAAVLLLLAGWMVWSNLRRPPAPGMAQVRHLRCAACGRVTTATNAQIAAEVAVDPVDLAWPAMRCPGCGQSTLRLARQCPNDGEVFDWYVASRDSRNGPGRGEAKCPRCGWDPANAEQERLRRLTAEK